MPIEILALVVIVGIGVVVAAVYFSSKAANDTGLDIASARSILAIDFPEFQAREVYCDPENRSAILHDPGAGEFGLVTFLGTRPVTRLVDSKTVTGWTHADQTFKIMLSDTTLASVSISITSKSEAEAISNILDRFADKQ